MYEIDKFEWCSHKRGNRVEGRRCPEKCPWKKTPPPQEIASRRITIRKYGTQESFPLEIYPASTFAKILLMKIAAWPNVTKNVAGVVDLPLSLLNKVFQRYLSVRHIAQLVAHGKTARIAKSVLCKIVSRKDIISNKQFRAPTIYCQVLIFVDKLYWFFFHRRPATNRKSEKYLFKISSVKELS